MRRALGILLGVAACSSPGREADDGRDSLDATCAATGRRGSLLVARPDPTEEETGITFKLLGDGAGPGVVLCGEVLYADAAALLGLMGEAGTADVAGDRAVIDGTPTEIPAYRHEGAVYVAVVPFARRRRALLVPSTDHPMDATVWPRATLLHLKASGSTRGAAYQAAVREGLIPD